MLHRLHREQFVPGDPDEIWAFFAAPENLDKITPPDMSFQIVGSVDPAMFPGQMIEYRIGVLPGVRSRWVTEITHVREGEYFVDEQRIGPYRLWHHEHRYKEVPGARGLHMTDLVTYDVGKWPLGELVHALWIRRKLEAIFDFRTKRIAELFRQ